MSDWEWLKRKADAAEREEERLLAEARQRAAREGKEPFDFTALCELYDPTSDLAVKLHDPERRAKELEQRYYVDFPMVRTLAEFARTMSELDAYR
jgi:hypothetical protein